MPEPDVLGPHTLFHFPCLLRGRWETEHLVTSARFPVLGPNSGTVHSSQLLLHLC